jgi:hypothetical protein
MYDRTKTMVAKDDILSRVADLLESNPAETAAALSLASVDAYAKAHPPKLTAAARAIIKENYPDATDELISERAMSDYGTSLSITSSIVTAQVAMDYSPLSYVMDQLAADQALPSEKMQAAQAVATRAFEEIRAIGMSPFGAASMMIGMSSVLAQKDGASAYQLLRPLFEAALRGIGSERTPQMQKDIEAAALDAISKEMGISRTAVKRYLKGLQ